VWLYDSVDASCGHRWREHGQQGRSQGCYAKDCRCRLPRPVGVPDGPPVEGDSPRVLAKSDGSDSDPRA
jgi:hypothetical protein